MRPITSVPFCILQARFLDPPVFSRRHNAAEEKVLLAINPSHKPVSYGLNLCLRAHTDCGWGGSHWTSLGWALLHPRRGVQSARISAQAWAQIANPLEVGGLPTDAVVGTVVGTVVVERGSAEPRLLGMGMCMCMGICMCMGLD